MKSPPYERSRSRIRKRGCVDHGVVDYFASLPPDDPGGGDPGGGGSKDEAFCAEHRPSEVPAAAEADRLS